MSILAWAVLALIVAGCLYVLWLALQDPGRDPFLEVDDEWPGAVYDWEQPWADAGPVDHAAWLKSMQDPQTPDEIRRAAIGAQRLRDAMHEQALREGDDFIHGMTDGGSA